jgi:hypothetical protein
MYISVPHHLSTWYDDAVDADPKGSLNLNIHCVVKRSDAKDLGFEIIAPGMVLVMAALTQKVGPQLAQCLVELLRLV